MRGEKPDDCESPIIDDCVNDDGVPGDPPTLTMDIINQQQQLMETKQPDHLCYDNRLLQYKSQANVTAAAAAGDDDHNDLIAGSAGTVEAIVVKPSTVDATIPQILKYSRESEEKPANVQSVNHDDYMSSDESLLMTCEFCGAEINPDFTPVHNKDNNDSSDSEEVKMVDILNILSFTHLYTG